MRGYSGKYVPKHPDKYLGNINDIVYRSLLERRFMIYCDENPNVLKWNSEEIVIPYMSPVDHRVHRYFVDFLIEVKTKTGDKEVILIEVKPYAQCYPPKPPKKQTRRYLNECATYAINQAKWDAAKALCKKEGWKWKVLTEKELKPGKK